MSLGILYRGGTVSGMVWAMVVVGGLLTLGGCSSLPMPEELNVPEPISNSGGKYLCPFTSQGTLAPWATKGIEAMLGNTAGQWAGKQAGDQVASNIPFVGGVFGKEVEKESTKQATMLSVGGESYMRQTSDLSFNSVEDLAVYMFAKYSNHEKYTDVLAIAQEIYPDLKERFSAALANAKKK
jgi:hypothetical protein